MGLSLCCTSGSASIKVANNSNGGAATSNPLNITVMSVPVTLPSILLRRQSVWHVVRHEIAQNLHAGAHANTKCPRLANRHQYCRREQRCERVPLHTSASHIFTS